ncbi:MAG: hypothetical protein RMX65_017250 [Nostoc sp. DedQUE01]
MSQLIQLTLLHTPKLKPYIEITTKREVTAADGSRDFLPHKMIIILMLWGFYFLEVPNVAPNR